MIDIEMLMAYCRADEDAKEAVIDAANDARDYLADMRASPSHNIYNKAYKALTLQFFDNPDGGTFSPALQKLLNALKL